MSQWPHLLGGQSSWFIPASPWVLVEPDETMNIQIPLLKELLSVPHGAAWLRAVPPGEVDIPLGGLLSVYPHAFAEDLKQPS